MSEFALKPDYEQSKKRYEAFWHRELVDRPPTALAINHNRLPRDPAPIPAGAQIPADAPAALSRTYASHRDRWLDATGRAERMAWELEQVEWLGDALPIAVPNLGPEIFSAWCGAGYEFGATTTWSEPLIADWQQVRTGDVDPSLDTEHPLFLALDALTDALLERAAGRFIVGLTDFHPGGDHLAALRDPAELAIDLIERPDEVKRLLAQAAAEYTSAYDHFFHKLRDAGMPITSWLQLIHDGRYYIPSNDFSALISPAMFEEFFLEGIAEECRFLDRSIYHLDGPDALRHLPMLLEIEELDAVQWVPGVALKDFARWIPVYQQVQNAGKGINVVDLAVGDLDLLFEHLRPEGLYISGVSGVTDREGAEHVLKRLAAWR